MNEQRQRRDIRAISRFCYFVAVLHLFAGISAAAILARGGQLGTRQVVGSAFFLGIGVFHLVLARGLSFFRAWARKVAIVLCALGLLLFPFGTILCGFFLHALIKRWPGSIQAATISRANP